MSDLVDSQRPSSLNSRQPWGYRRIAWFDLNDDGSAERILLQAAVHVDDAGQPMWDDGQTWEIVVEGTAGEQTRVYSQYVQLGEVEASVLPSSDGGTILVVEQGSARIRLFEIVYRGPGAFDGCQLYDREVEAWVLGREK